MTDFASMRVMREDIGIALLEQAGYLLDLVGAERQFDDRIHKVQRLASQKVHRNHGLEKHDRRRRHATPDDRVCHSFEQDPILRGKSFSVRGYGKGVRHTGTNFLERPDKGYR